MNLPVLEFDPNPEALLNPAKLIQPHPAMPAGCVFVEMETAALTSLAH